MSTNLVYPDTDLRTKVQKRDIVRVPDQDGIFIAPSMAGSMRIKPNTAIPNNPLLRPGLRLGDWSQVMTDEYTVEFMGTAGSWFAHHNGEIIDNHEIARQLNEKTAKIAALQQEADALRSENDTLRAALRDIEHSMNQALLPGNDVRRELNLTRNIARRLTRALLVQAPQ